jgi:thymidylate synthase (FAD)
MPDIYDTPEVSLEIRPLNELHIDKIARLSRVSKETIDEGDRTIEDSRRLVSFMIFNGHMEPFEMVKYTFHVKCSLDVAIHFLRHRTASFNMLSRRYNTSTPKFPVPDIRFVQDNFETSGALSRAFNIIDDAYKRSIEDYTELLNMGVEPEVARRVLGVGMMTQFYISIDLRNLLHLIDVRTDKSAMKETRDIALSMEKYVMLHSPLVYRCYDRMRNLKDKYCDAAEGRHRFSGLFLWKGLETFKCHACGMKWLLGNPKGTVKGSIE